MICWLFSLSMLLGTSAQADAVPRGSTAGRAELAAYHESARAVTTEVLELPEFADLKRGMDQWWIAFLRWIGEHMRDLGNFFEGIPKWLFVVVLAWLILTLLAILAHFVYVLIGLISSGSQQGRGAGYGERGQGELLGIRDLEFDSVYRRAREQLAEGRWQDATRYLYVAAILWLDRQGWLGFRVSKTNYDYLNELVRHPGHRARFRDLTDRFEVTVYGGKECTPIHCQEMASLVENLLREATPVISN